MTDNVYEIKIRIHEESELYNPLDPEQELLSDELISYMTRRYSEKEDIGSELILNIISDQPVHEEKIRKNFEKYIDHEQTILSKQQRQTAVKQIRLFLIGIAFIAIWLVFAVNTENIFVEVLSIIGSFAIWEAADIWIVEAPEMRIRKRRLERFRGIHIIFSK